MAWGAVAGFALGIAQSIEANNAYMQQLGYETASKLAGISAIKDAYIADVDAMVVQNFLNEQSAQNAIVEVQRATAANVREAQLEVKKGASTLVAQSGESVTGGASKARELSSFYSRASKVVGKVEEQGRGQVIKVADTLDRATNEINAKAEQSYNKMLLALAGVSQYSSLQAPSVSGALAGMAQGVQMGTQFEQNVNDLIR
jgi:hypothetical protein